MSRVVVLLDVIVERRLAAEHLVAPAAAEPGLRREVVRAQVLLQVLAVIEALRAQRAAQPTPTRVRNFKRDVIDPCLAVWLISLQKNRGLFHRLVQL